MTGAVTAGVGVTPSSGKRNFDGLVIRA
jgi:hypothetical protein